MKIKLLLPAIVLVAFVGAAQAQTTIIQDGFSQNGTIGHWVWGVGGSSTGLNPDTVNLPGTTWQGLGGYPANNDYESQYYGNAGAYIRSASSDGIALGGYATGILQTSVTAAFQVTPYYNVDYPITSTGYLLAGFSSANLAVSVSNGGYYSPRPGTLSEYTGLAIMGDGSLQEYVGGTAIADVAWAGSPLTNFGQVAGYSPAVTLNYNLNTATGAITNVSLSIAGFGTSTADYSTFATAPGGFTLADVTDAQIGASGGNNQGTPVSGDNTGDVSNYGNFTAYQLTAEAVPEPATCAMALGGLGMLLGLQRMRRRNA